MYRVKNTFVESVGKPFIMAENVGIMNTGYYVIMSIVAVSSKFNLEFILMLSMIKVRIITHYLCFGLIVAAFICK